MTEAKPEPYLMSFEELVSGDHESYIQQLINEGVETDGERTPLEKKEAIKHIVFLDVAIKLATDSLGRNLAFTALEVLESREELIRLGLNRIKALGFTEREAALGVDRAFRILKGELEPNKIWSSNIDNRGEYL